MKSWEKNVELFSEGQRILERQRFQFPSTWLDTENIEGEWSAFNDILKRKDGSIQTQVASLQMKVGWVVVVVVVVMVFVVMVFVVVFASLQVVKFLLL